MLIINFLDPYKILGRIIFIILNMYKHILLACALVASVVSGSKHHELEQPKLQQQAWNVAGTKALVK